MAAPPTLTEKLSNIQHMPSLLQATIASDKPTDGYLVRDIVKMSYESAQTRIFLMKYLTNSLLTSKNVYVKIKVLKLVINILEEGHPEFHRGLQKTPEAFKDASTIRASNSSLAGDCGRIRDLANKVLDIIYSEPPSSRTCPYGLSSSSGNTSESGSMSSGLLGSGGKMTGFGNTSSEKGQFRSTMDTLFGTAKPKVSSRGYDSTYATMDAVPQPSRVGGVGGGPSTIRGGQFNSTSIPIGTGHVKGQAGGGWDEERQTAGLPHSSEGVAGGSDGEQERRLVDTITAPGGVKVAPSKDAMKHFITRCKVLDCLVIVEHLKMKLESDDHQVVMKALFVVEALARSDINDITSYLDLVLDELTQLSTSSSQPSLKAKATKILNQLNAVETTVLMPMTNVLMSTTQPSSDNIDNEDENKQDDSGDVSGLFAGLSLSSGTPPTTSSTSSTRSSGSRQYKKPPAVQKKQRTESNNSLLGDLSEVALTGESIQQPSQPTHTSQPPPPHQGTTPNGGDLLDFGEDENQDFDPLTSTTPSQTGVSILGDLSSLEQPTQAPPTTTPTMTPLIPSDTPLIASHDQPNIPTPAQGGVMYRPMVNPGATDGPVMMTGGVVPGGVVMAGGTYQYTTYTGQTLSGIVMGGENRPLQRMPSETETSSSGFGFLSKSSKSSAFDFVQDEIKASMK